MQFYRVTVTLRAHVGYESPEIILINTQQRHLSSNALAVPQHPRPLTSTSTVASMRSWSSTLPGKLCCVRHLA